MHEISSSVSDEKLVCQQLQSDPRSGKVAAEKARNMPDTLLIESRGPVVLVALNRPEKLNAVSNGLISGLMSALDRIELDRSAQAIVITGAGRAFSAGADISEFQRHMKEGPSEAVARFMRPGHRMTRRVESFPKPIIAAVKGLAFGAGCELVEATHIAFAAESAAFSKSEINIGIIPTFGGDATLAKERGAQNGA